MATLCYFPSCYSISSRKLFSTHRHQLSYPNLEPYGDRPLKHFYVRASSTKKPRKSRKLKSDAELCNDIREFIATVGLPEDHIPSTKELLQHGRNDLANIVRRRGYKLIRDLLARSSNAADTDKSLDEILDADSEDFLTGQNVKVDNAAVDVTVSTNIALGIMSSGLETDSTPNLNDCTCISSEFSTNSSLEEDDPWELKDHSQEANNMAEGNSYPIEASVMDNDCSSSRKDSDPNFDDQSCMYEEISYVSSFEERSSGNLGCKDNTVLLKDWYKLEGPDDRNNNIADNIPSTAEVSILESSISDGAKTVNICDDSYINEDSSANLSLEEKVAKFIRSGELDPVEDHVSVNGNGSEESNVYTESESFTEMPLRTPSGEHSKYQPKDTAAMLLNGSSLTSKQGVPSAKAHHFSRDDHIPAEDLTAHLDNNLDAEDTKRSNQIEINHLKFMLHQKELELSQLKEQIEKEKFALSVLQTTAETEISKARKLIADKDSELNAAEESLSGLKEVQIQFCGDADIVEVAGSFNGWNHRIEMEPQPSTSVIDLSGSRRSRLWSTVLWLYPGIYEIKFIVDGHWRIDTQMESITRGHICNNILRVDR